MFCCDHLRMTYYKSRNATASQRLWGIYHEKNGGYEAAVRAWRLMPRTQETVRWRALAWAAHHWKWLIASVVIPVLGLLIR